MVTQYVRIPQDRIGVLIGHNGIVKENIEKKSDSRIEVDSTEGEVYIVIEDITGVKISVYGKSIGIIGYPHQAIAAHDAIEMLINGSPHSAVYSFLEKKRRAEERDFFRR